MLTEFESSGHLTLEFPPAKAEAALCAQAGQKELSPVNLLSRKGAKYLSYLRSEGLFHG
jgi:hypothetical protein